MVPQSWFEGAGVPQSWLLGYHSPDRVAPPPPEGTWDQRLVYPPPPPVNRHTCENSTFSSYYVRAWEILKVALAKIREWSALNILVLTSSNICFAKQKLYGFLKTFYLQNRLFRLHIMWSNGNIENRVSVSTTSDTSRIKSLTKSNWGFHKPLKLSTQKCQQCQLRFKSCAIRNDPD